MKQQHNLRRVSVSPWADKAKMAEQLGDKYIYSLKPSPSPLANSAPDWDGLRQELRETLEMAQGCVVEIIMKDNVTIGHCPENLVEWCRIAREEADRIGG